jgi:serine/threonine protein kinase
LRDTLRRFLASATESIAAGASGTADLGLTMVTPVTQMAAPVPEKLSTYRVVRRLGAGGMGEVFEGFDQRLQRRVALKMIGANAVTDEEARGRFLREARVLSSLNHPSICAIHDYPRAG